MESKPRLEVQRTSEAGFDLFVYRDYGTVGEQESPTYRCFRSNIYITFKINCLKDERKIEFYIKPAVYDGENICTMNVTLRKSGQIHRQKETKTSTDWTIIGYYEPSLIKDYNNSHIFNISIGQVVEAKSAISTSKLFYEDEHYVDIKLRGEDVDSAETVSFHRICLANCSEMLRSMVSGEWREAREGVARLPTDTDTLRHFKEYVYLRKLPHDGAKCLRLRSLANYCMMPELAAACADIIAADTQPQATWNWLESCVLTKDFSQLRILARSFTEERVVEMENMFKEKEAAANGSKDPESQPRDQ